MTRAAPARDAASIRAMFAAIAARYDLANHLLSAGIDRSWRRHAAAKVRTWAPGVIVDVAAGSGDLSLALKRACPDACIIALDFCEPMLRCARNKGLTHVVAADALQLPFSNESVDAITVAFGLRNMSSWPGALAQLRRILRTGGHLLVLDFSVPNRPLRWIYRPYLHHILPRLAALITGSKQAYDYLGDSIEEFPHGAGMCALLQTQGFHDARAKPLAGGIVSIYTATR